ncbi:MAG: DNA gyrase inhibitor YacG [Acidobacteria bacterium]|nr:DNA gyrase inhibitor YacG [Acidobacteriota bacterium]
MCAVMKCPICKRPVRWEGNAYRPFCSDRCQTLDLGNWATERYTVPVENAPENEEAEEASAEE